MVRGLICCKLLEKMDVYHGHLILDLMNLIEDFSPYKKLVSKSIKGDIDCYPFYMNDIENIIESIEGGEVEEVYNKENYDCQLTEDRNNTYYDYLNNLSKRLVKIYNRYKSVEDELNPKHSFMNDIENILNRINKRKEVYDNQLKNNMYAAKLRSPLNRLSSASPYKRWFRKTRRSKKNRSTRKRK